MADTRDYKCKVCNKDFKYARSRNRHEQQVHSDGGAVECNDCGAVFSRKETLNRHRKSHGSVQNIFTCNVCQKTFGRRDKVNEHQRQVHGGVHYDCEHCTATFSQKYKLKKHLEKHSENKGGKPMQNRHKQNFDHSSDSKDTKDYNRDAVPSTSKQSEMDQRQGKQTRSKTRKQMKRKAYLSPSTLNSTDSSDAGQSSKSMAKCKACSWEGQSLRAHLNQSTKSCINMYDNQALGRDAQKKHEEQKTKWESQHKKDRNKKKRQKRADRRQLPVDRAYELTCFCGKTFGTSYAKHRHIEEAHTNLTEPVQCPKCSKSFKRREHLRDHLDSVHDKSTSVKCPYCRKELRSSMSFMRHIKEVHERKLNLPVLPQVCNICEKKFSRKEYLDRHISDVHLRQNRFSCPHCKNTYVRKGVLERHLFVAHQKQGERMIWPCPDCPEYFFREDILDKHEKRGKHSFYEYCKYCDEVLLFKSFNAMNSHFVKVKSLTYIERTRGFSKDTCVTKLQRDKNQLEKFEQGSTNCIHCNETVPNKDYHHWVQDYEDPGKGTCINNLMRRTHITCWMCKERVVIKDYFNKENNGYGYFNLLKNRCHYSNIKDPCSCRAAMKNRREFEKKKKHLKDILEKIEKNILNNIPLEKNVGFEEYHIICCNS